jgi:ankyrin repeat protein
LIISYYFITTVSIKNEQQNNLNSDLALKLNLGIKEKDYLGQNALIYAAKNGHVDNVKLLNPLSTTGSMVVLPGAEADSSALSMIFLISINRTFLLASARLALLPSVFAPAMPLFPPLADLALPLLAPPPPLETGDDVKLSIGARIK